MKDFISKIVKDAIRKATEYEVDICLDGLSAEVIEGAPKVHLSLDAGISKEELLKILGMVSI